MTDDAPRPGTPNPEDASPPPSPDSTVLRPHDPAAIRPDAAPVDPSDPASVPPRSNDGGPLVPPGGASDHDRDHGSRSDHDRDHDTRHDTRHDHGTRDTHAAAGGGAVVVADPVRARRAGPAAAVVAIGTGLLGAATVIAAERSRVDGDLDWSNFLVGCGAAAILLGAAVLGTFLARRREGGRAREDVVTWPGVVGILAGVVMLNVGLNVSDDWMGYVTGGIVVALAALGYLAARRAAFIVLAIGGLALIYGLVLDDLFADALDNGNPGVVAAAVVGIFVVAITLIGWLFPTRDVTGVVVGVVGLVAYIGIMIGFLVSRLISEIFGDLFSFSEGSAGTDFGDSSDLGLDGGFPLAPDPGMGDLFGFAESDVWWVLAFAGVLTLMWAIAAWLTGNSGFTIAAIAMPAALVPLATVVLAVEHPTWWSAVLAAAGGLLLLGAVLLARLRARKHRETTYDAAVA